MQVNVVLKERHDVASLLESQDVHLDVFSSHRSDGAVRRLLQNQFERFHVG